MYGYAGIDIPAFPSLAERMKLVPSPSNASENFDSAIFCVTYASNSHCCLKRRNTYRSGVWVNRKGTALKPESVTPVKKVPVLRTEASQNPWAKASTSESPSFVENRLEGGSSGKAETSPWEKDGIVQNTTSAKANEA
jgi:hypothetical protein